MQEKILIVDDDKVVRDVCREALISEEYEITTSENGQDAYEVARQQYFNLVISDIRMPKMGGLELLGNLKKLNPDLTVIMFSGLGDVNSAVEAMKHGAYDYLAKPLVLEELKATVRLALQQTKLKEENTRIRKEMQGTLSTLNTTPPAIPLLNNLPLDMFKEFLNLGKMRTYDTQEIILHKGTPDKNLYIVFEGEITVWQDGSKLFKLGKFDCYGEMNIFKPHIVIHDLIAEEPSKVMAIRRDALIDFFNNKDEKYFKHIILNTLNSQFAKTRKISNRVIFLERKMRS
ncbi:hypothetical protein CEE37_10660 [candidate division LCP-89 bacterium B3_LCP]|uniref:Response regulator n=1 Tax=candidate division LCP-89 bacterium B3_LCP TaxID=2012998 RepID=A0A532UXR3_UNCL8|nr:MAG: hypothetical protein CEE37_10660 [candidate division LCP-89 bacterium B3_LCP]